MARTNPTEQTLVKAILDYLALRGCFVWRTNQGGVKASYKGRERFVRFNHAKGISDVIGLLPDGRFIAVEAKRKPNKPTDDQLSFLRTVAANGGLAIVAYTVDDVVEAMKGAA